MANAPRIDAADDLPLGKRAKLYVEGYEVQVSPAVDPGFDSDTQLVHVYGSDDPLTSAIVNNSTLAIEVLEKANNNVLLEVLTAQRPEANVLKYYKWQEFKEVTVWMNLKHGREDRYVRAHLWRRWRPAPGAGGMAPNEWGRRTFAGQCDLEQRFDEAAGVGVRIESEKLAASSSGGGLGWTATLSKTPVQVPGEQRWLLRLLAIDGTQAGAVTASDEIEIDEQTCGGSTTVFVDNEELIDAKGTVDYLFAQYLITGSGTLPIDTGINMDGLYRSF
jgi:hypothetical protein